MNTLLLWVGLVSLLAAAFGAGCLFGARRAAGRFSERHLALEEERTEIRTASLGRRAVRLNTVSFRRGNAVER